MTLIETPSFLLQGDVEQNEFDLLNRISGQSIVLDGERGFDFAKFADKRIGAPDWDPEAVLMEAWEMFGLNQESSPSPR